MGKLIGTLMIAGGALAGSYVGEALYQKQNGQQLGTSQPSTEVLVANAIPAVGIALLTGWPRTLYAFLGGVISAAILGDRSPLLGLLSKRQSTHHPTI